MKQRTEEWIQKAEGDWRIAQRELDSEEPVWDGICFHAQQCAEKYLKAVLEEQEVEVPKIHDLVVLLDRTEEWSEKVAALRSALARLSTFGVATRYPGMDADEEAAREAMHTAGQVRSAVRQALEVV